jgi:hypothetical protein
MILGRGDPQEKGARRRHCQQRAFNLAPDFRAQRLFCNKTGASFVFFFLTVTCLPIWRQIKVAFSMQKRNRPRIAWPITNRGALRKGDGLNTTGHFYSFRLVRVAPKETKPKEKTHHDPKKNLQK